MKFGLALAFLSALAHSALAMTGQSMEMIANRNGGSGLNAIFYDHVVIIGEEYLKLNFDVILSGTVNDYVNMKCVAEVDAEQVHPATARTITVPVSEYAHQTAGYVGFAGSVSLNSGDYIGKLTLSCSFTPLRSESASLQAVVYGSFGGLRQGVVSTKGSIAPFRGFAEKFAVSLASVSHSPHPTTFTITNPLKNLTGYIYEVRTTSVATTGTNVIFRSVKPSVAYCDAVYDGEFLRTSVTVSLASDNRSITLKFSHPPNEFSEIVVTCPELTGVKIKPQHPAILAAVYQRDPDYANYFVAGTAGEDVSFSSLFAFILETSPEILV